MWLYSASYVPGAHAQSTSGTIVENLTFHNYSLTQKAANNSLFVYDGADASGPKLTSAFQTTLSSQIMGTRSGFTYWDAVIIWTVKLQKDVHVLGNVDVRAYISSTFGLSGLFNGGGYGMGIVDIDENGNDIKEFTTEAPYTIGSNPFTGTPKAYALSVSVDYVFKKGHYIGFYVGAGATVQGFTFTVYFDSPDRNSGASLPIENQADTSEFGAVWEGKPYEIVAVSNFSLSNFGFNQPEKQISFDALGIRGTSGYCRVGIPKTLLGGPFKVLIDSQQITPTVTENTTHSIIYFTYTHSSDTIKIVGTTAIPEFSSSTILLLFMITTLLVAILLKKRKKPEKMGDARALGRAQLSCYFLVSSGLGVPSSLQFKHWYRNKRR